MQRGFYLRKQRGWRSAFNRDPPWELPNGHRQQGRPRVISRISIIRPGAGLAQVAEQGGAVIGRAWGAFGYLLERLFMAWGGHQMVSLLHRLMSGSRTMRKEERFPVILGSRTTEEGLLLKFSDGTFHLFDTTFLVSSRETNGDRVDPLSDWLRERWRKPTR
jgi:hypothetical protein